MTTIAPAYAYADGAALSIVGHNLNMYSETAGEGFYSESNGGLSSANLDGKFKVQDHHVWPEEAIRVRSDYMRDSIDYFSEAETGADVAEDAAREELFNVAGCGLRFYVPYASSVLWNVGFFVNIFRLHRGSSSNQEDSTNQAFGDVRLQLSISEAGGAYSVISHSKRTLPVSARLDTTSFGLSVYESTCAFRFDLHHFSRDIAAGWHDIHLKLLLSEPAGGLSSDVTRSIPKDNGSTRDRDYSHRLHNRVTFGIRNPVAIVFAS